jgi:hypothetical protein
MRAATAFLALLPGWETGAIHRLRRGRKGRASGVSCAHDIKEIIDMAYEFVGINDIGHIR